MNEAELDQLMKDSAKDAVSTAKVEFDIQLDYSPESIQNVDSAILSFLEKYAHVALEDKAVFTICNIFGAYVGEVYKSISDGHWIYDVSESDAPSIYMKLNDLTFAFAGVCFEKLVRNQDISIEEYFVNAVSKSKA
ncbi:hypothetical protein [Agaribacter marinus]|uniref:DUF3806 domain-containing protein n=1 Tax=Agaribacter marinus TaxID=1431249 RepID=A0AA37SXP4_9ALTE|nr:hypothetical protein [Agaribacter marinus]GLR70439.1 hypothetical protein GCM10007852_13470 [Agaribacter marinus]